MWHPKDVGDRSTVAIIFALHSQGLSIFMPRNNQYKRTRLAAAYEIARIDLV
jgi:hypothetical protein